MCEVTLPRKELPSWLSGKESVCRAEDLGSIPGSGIAPGEGNGYPLQYSCLGNPMDRGAWCPWCPKEYDTTERLALVLAPRKVVVLT